MQYYKTIPRAAKDHEGNSHEEYQSKSQLNKQLRKLHISEGKERMRLNDSKLYKHELGMVAELQIESSIGEKIKVWLTNISFYCSY